MMRVMRKRIVAAVMSLALMTGWLAPSAALARQQEDDKEIFDARYESYPVEVNVKSPGSAGAYFLLALLGVLSVGVMFKDARRSHLD